MSDTVSAQVREIAARNLAEQGASAVDDVLSTARRARELLVSGEVEPAPAGIVRNVPDPARSNLKSLVAAARKDEAIALLMAGVRQVGATGPRSAQAALAVAEKLCAGDLMLTISFMNRRHRWLDGQTLIERAEQSEDGLDFALEMITAIDYGVYI